MENLESFIKQPCDIACAFSHKARVPVDTGYSCWQACD